MLLFEDALKIVISCAAEYQHDIERVSLSGSLGRVLAKDIFSDMDMPPFDKSAVDGFAFREPAVPRNSVTWQVVETIPAGAVPQITILPGQCSKIMTGAMVPAGADKVIMVEDTELAGENLVRFKTQNPAKNICYRGENVRIGDLVLQRGTMITPAHIAVLASVGAGNPVVAKLPKVGIISTGDELVEPAVSPGIAQIRNSNGWQLEAQVKTVPAQPFYLGIAADAGAELRKTIDLAMANNDVVLITGGVSMGDFDFVPAVMEEAGIEILFKSIAIQPGKPTVFGRCRDKNTFIFGLPGNPVSSFVLFEMMVKPFLRRMMGNSDVPLSLNLPIGVNFSRKKSIRKTMIPVMIRDGAVFPVGYHGSAHINAFTIANGILVLEIGTTNIQKGELVNVRPL